jgi:GNAT superfamily N-acetyltransferase
MREAANLLHSETAGIEIRKDLQREPRESERKRQPEIRPASMADVLALVATNPDEALDADDLWERRLRHHIVDAIGVEGCFVADVPGIGPAFMQFLFTADDNDRLQSNFAGLFPVLAADEALVEFLYVAPESRNPGVAVNCLIQVADEARRVGAASVMSFIDPSNKGALFVNHLAGFQAHSVRRRKRRLFRSTYTFEEWPADASRALSDLASGKATIS